MDQTTERSGMNTIDDVRKAIQELRENGASNDDLISAACRLLFMQTGELPSQSRVLDLVRVPGSSPSSNTVQKGINKFWASIRDRVGVSLSHPEVPKDVVEKTGDALTLMWRACMESAEKSLLGRRQELEQEFEKKNQEREVEVAEARAALEAAKESEMRAIHDAAKAREDAAAATADMEAAKRDLGIANGINENLKSQLDEAKGTVSELNQQIEAARQDTERKLSEAEALLVREKDKLNGEIARLQSAVQACDEIITRLRVDVDREIRRSENYRNDLASAKNEIQEITRSSAKMERDHQEKIVLLTQEHGELKGSYTALESERTSLAVRVDELLRANAVLEHENKALHEKFNALTKDKPRKSKVSDKTDSGRSL